MFSNLKGIHGYSSLKIKLFWDHHMCLCTSKLMDTRGLLQKTFFSSIINPLLPLFSQWMFFTSFPAFSLYERLITSGNAPPPKREKEKTLKRSRRKWLPWPDSFVITALYSNLRERKMLSSKSIQHFLIPSTVCQD